MEEPLATLSLHLILVTTVLWGWQPVFGSNSSESDKDITTTLTEGMYM